MKKIKSLTLIGLLMVMGFVFGAGISVTAATTPLKLHYEPTLINGRVVEVPLELTKQVTVKGTTIQAADDNRSISLSIADPNHLQNVYDSNEYYKIIYGGSSTDYDYYGNYSPVNITRTNEGWTIVFSYIIWGSDSCAYLTVTTSKYAFYQRVNTSQLGTTIPLVVDDTYVPVTANVNNIGSGEVMQGIQVNWNDGNGKFINVGTIQSGGFVKKGLYDFKVLDSDNNSAYYLTKQDCNLNGTNGIALSFDKTSLGLVKVNINNTSGMNFIKNGVVLDSGRGSGGNLLYITGKSLYVTKMNYNYMNIYCFTANEWQYIYQTNTLNVIDDSSSITVGTKLSLKYLPSQTVYASGDYFNDIQIRDEYNNLAWFYDPTNMAVGTFTLTDEKGIVTTITAENSSYPYFKLPNVAGKYTVSYKIDGSLIPVTALAPISITVSEQSSGGGPSTPVTPQYLSSYNISAHQIDLSWSAYADGTYSYNIYRATSISGTYTKIGTSYSGTYFDTGVAPNTNYWYKVSSSFNDVESDLSTPLATATNNSASVTNKISFQVSDVGHVSYVKSNNSVFDVKDPNATSTSYISPYFGTPYVSSTEEGWLITYDSDQFKNYNEFTSFIHTSKYMFKSTFNQTNFGTVISLQGDSTYATITPNISFVDGTLYNISYVLDYCDHDGVLMRSGISAPDEKISAGTYDIILSANDNSMGYNLLAKGVQLGSNNILTFDRKNIGKLKININDTTNKNILLDYVEPTIGNEITNLSTSMNFNNKVFDSIYINKGNIPLVQLSCRTPDYNISLYYETSPVAVNDDNASVTVDTNFKAYINAKSSAYYPGDHIELGVKDSLNNKLTSMNTNSGSLTGEIDIKDGNGSIVSATPLSSSGTITPYLNAPSSNGSYDITYTINSPIPISAATAKITVDSTAQPTTIPVPYLSVNSSSSSELDLWIGSSTYENSYYNIYRASSSGGTYTKIGTTFSSAYFDTDVTPSTNYWYKASMVLNGTESGLSNPLNASTSNEVSTLSRLSFLIADINHESNVKSNDSMIYYKSGTYYNGLSLGTPWVTSVKEGWKISYNLYQLNDYDNFVACIHTSKTLFIKTFEKTDVGTVIPLQSDGSYTTLATSIPFVDGILSNVYYGLQYYDKEGNAIYLGKISQDIAIPDGKYDITLLANDNTKAYELVTKEVQISSENHVLSYDRNSIGCLNTSFNYAASNAYLIQLIPYTDTQMPMFQISMVPDNKKLTAIYLNKGNYTFNMFYQISSNLQYCYMTPSVDISGNNAVITVDTNFKAFINTKEQTYYPYSHFSSFGVEDSMNNILTGVSGSSSTITGTVDFKDANGTVVSSSVVNDPFSPYIDLPIINGTFDMVYSITGTDKPIASATASITIDASNYLIPSAPQNFTISEATTSYVKLIWNNVSGANYYKIYRSYNGGNFECYDYASANSYIDYYTNPGIYKYYVCAVNNAGEGDPSNTLTHSLLASSLGDVNNDGNIDIIDYNMVRQYLLGQPIVQTYDITHADVDGDGVITSRDLALIQRYILNRINVFPNTLTEPTTLSN